MKIIYSKNNNKNNKAFAILFAILLSSFLITLGTSIFSISIKEIQIITSSRDSQIAYYAADSARECALYWDVKQGAFPTCLNNDCTLNTFADKINPIVCNGNNIYLVFTKPSTTIYQTYNSNNLSNVINSFFQYSAVSSSSPIADLSIVKEFSSSRVKTTIKAYGHNTDILGRRVERGIQQISNQ